MNSWLWHYNQPNQHKSQGVCLLITEYQQLPSCFITATDTDAGKTFVAGQILRAWQQQGLTVGAFKPIASGAIWQAGVLVSEDAIELAKVTAQPLHEINPYTFEKPASPHLADVSKAFDLNQCVKQYRQISQQYDRLLVEGVGGWCVPLSEDLMLKDLAIALGLPIVMVSRIGLGCINHSLLTIQQIKSDTQLYHGWIANQIDPKFEDTDSNIQAISART